MSNLYLDSTAHIKPFLQIVGSSTYDTVLTLLNGMACESLDRILNVDSLARATYTDERVDGGAPYFFTKNFPVISVSAIKQGSAETLWTQTADLLIEKNKVTVDGVLGGGTGYEQNKITYVGGYITYAQNASGGAYEAQGETMPNDLKLAALLLLAGLFNQRQNIGVQSFSIQGQQTSFRDDLEGQEFERIINRYKKVAQYIGEI
jgi:hypothetical protein